jgi:hypothetical protein
MTPEEYERFKEAEKDHLRKMRALKKTHRQMSRKARITGAVTDMTEGISKLFQDHEEMVERLERSSTISQARMDLALETFEPDDRPSTPSQSEAADAKPSPDSSPELPEKTIGRMKR